MKRWSHASKAAGVAVALALAAFLWLALWPNFYTGVAAEATTPGQPPVFREYHRSLPAQNGWQILPVILFPLMISGIGLLITLWADTFNTWTRVLMWVNMLVLVGFCIAGIWTIGAFYLPVAIAMLTAAPFTQASGGPETRQQRRAKSR